MSQLTYCEAVIEQGRIKVTTGYIEIGAALCKIKEKKLYREQGFHTFEKYCHARWKFKREYAWRLIKAAALAKTLPVGNIPPTERNAIAAALRKLKSMGWLEILTGEREPGSVLQRTSSYRLTPQSDQLVKLANAHYAVVQKEIQIEKAQRAEASEERYCIS